MGSIFLTLKSEVVIRVAVVFATVAVFEEEGFPSHTLDDAFSFLNKFL